MLCNHMNQPFCCEESLIHQLGYRRPDFLSVTRQLCSGSAQSLQPDYLFQCSRPELVQCIPSVIPLAGPSHVNAVIPTRPPRCATRCQSHPPQAMHHQPSGPSLAASHVHARRLADGVPWPCSAARFSSAVRSCPRCPPCHDSPFAIAPAAHASPRPPAPGLIYQGLALSSFLSFSSFFPSSASLVNTKFSVLFVSFSPFVFSFAHSRAGLYSYFTS